jgi:hypothetical protein
MGGMTGYITFAYDGEFATLLIFNSGNGNPTSWSDDILGMSLSKRLAAHEKWCVK